MSPSIRTCPTIAGARGLVAAGELDGFIGNDGYVYKTERFVNLHSRDWFKPFVK